MSDIGRGEGGCMQCVNKRRKLSKVNRNNDTDTRANGGHACRLEKLQAMSDVGGYGHEKRILKEREEKKEKERKGNEEEI